ncbi:MAG TPA: ATP-binding protein [Aquabacterium sp.]|nr:ATP-binding protein [Aquabacterium sp.]HRH30075.1 ATP-binding protein [Aquabacterium sp.]
MFKPEVPDTGGPVVALIERKTTLAILGVGAPAVLFIYLFESLTRSIVPHDRFMLPVLAVLMVFLLLRLLRKPETLMSTQRIAVGSLQLFFVVGVLSLIVLTPHSIDVYWVSTTYMWTLLISLLLHITWPQRAAMLWSVALMVVVSIPPVMVRSYVGHEVWESQFLPLLINSTLVQMAVMLSLMGVSRMRQGVQQVLSTHGRIGPADARAALDQWLKTQTSELALARDTAEAASRAKSQFLAVMSHELRTPLHAMLVSADLLSERPDGAVSDREKRLINTIQNSGNHLLALIDQVLDLSRIEAGKLAVRHELLDVVEVCDRAIQAVSPLATRKGLTLTVDIHERLNRHRMGDALRLTQVLINLLANACKFTDHGRVSLKVRPMDHDEVVFEVDDTGMGMSPEVQQRVFDAFYQADHESTRRHGGVGLGLTITRDLIVLMGGRLEIASTPDQGTRIRVHVPLALVQGQRQSGLISQSRPYDIQNMKVLVVEDDPVNSMLACEVLMGAGALPHPVGSGEEALEYLQEHPIDVVLMDFRMPGMDGIEATRRIRQGSAGEQAAHLPVLGLTANAYIEDRQQCLEAGMSDVLTKPIERQALIKAIARWRQVEQA